MPAAQANSHRRSTEERRAETTGTERSAGLPAQVLWWPEAPRLTSCNESRPPPSVATQFSPEYRLPCDFQTADLSITERMAADLRTEPNPLSSLRTALNHETPR